MMFLFTRLVKDAPKVLLTFLVFSLSAGVVGGILFYTDSIGPTVFGEMVNEVQVDMMLDVTYSFYQQNETSYADLLSIVESQEAVQQAEWVYIVEDYGWVDDIPIAMKSYLGVDEGFFDSFPEAVNLGDGLPPLTNETCYLSVQMARAAHLEVGDNFTIRYPVWNETSQQTQYRNWTWQITGTFTSELLKRYYYWGQPSESTLHMITTAAGLEAALASEEGQWELLGSHQIWVSFDRQMILSQDPVQGALELDNTRKRIEQEALPFLALTWDGFSLRTAMNNYAYWSLGMRAVSLAFSLPAIFMGLMLVSYNARLLADEQRRDIGTIKTRGASSKQSFVWVLEAALVTGLIGSLGAVGIGALSAVLSAAVRTFFVFDLSLLGEVPILVTAESAMAVFAFAFAAGTIVSVPSAVKALMAEPAETHDVIERESLAGTEKMGSLLVDLIGLGISLYMLPFLVLLLGFATVYGETMAPIMIFITPLMAIAIFTVTRLFSRPTSRVKFKLLTRLKRQPHAVAAKVLAGSAQMHLRTEATGAMFVALVFMAGVFASVSATTGHTHLQDLMCFQVGSDLTVSVKENLHNVSISLLDNITAIEGVESASATWTITAFVMYDDVTWGWGQVNKSVEVIGVQPSRWAQSAFWLPYFAYKGNPQTALMELEGNHSNVISSFRPVSSVSYTGYSYVYVYGDRITLYVRGPKGVNSSHVRIVDTLTSEQGGGITYLPGSPDTYDFVIVDIDYLHACKNSTEVSRLFIRLQAGANATRVMEQVRELAPYSFDSITSVQELLDDTLRSRGSRAIYGVYTLEVVYSLVYLTGGVAVVTAMKIGKLKKQLAVLRALGAERRAMVTVILLDTLITVTIGAAIGASAAFALAAAFGRMPLVYMGTSAAVAWERLPIFLIVPVPLLAAIMIITLVAASCATYVTAVRSLSGSIAETIQYAE